MLLLPLLLLLLFQHPMLMSGEGRDEKKENALKTSLDYLDGFLAKDNYIAGSWLTIADISILASITQLEAMDYRLTGYRSVHTWSRNGGRGC